MTSPSVNEAVWLCVWLTNVLLDKSLYASCSTLYVVKMQRPIGIVK